MSSKIIALTFDDGPAPDTTLPILELLREYHAAASFFVLGKHITRKTVPILQQADAQGCEICSHSFSHSDMTQLSAEEIRAEITETAKRITDAIGKPPRFFRPPYIAVKDEMFDVIPLPFIEGYGVRDFDDAVSTEARIEGVLQKAGDGRIILLHDFTGNAQTVEALRALLPALKAEHYEFVTVSQLFTEKDIIPKPHNRILYSFAEQTQMYATDR